MNTDSKLLVQPIHDALQQAGQAMNDLLKSSRFMNQAVADFKSSERSVSLRWKSSVHNQPLASLNFDYDDSLTCKNIANRLIWVLIDHVNQNVYDLDILPEDLNINVLEMIDSSQRNHADFNPLMFAASLKDKIYDDLALLCARGEKAATILDIDNLSLKTPICWNFDTSDFVNGKLASDTVTFKEIVDFLKSIKSILELKRNSNCEGIIFSINKVISQSYLFGFIDVADLSIDPFFSVENGLLVFHGVTE